MTSLLVNTASINIFEYNWENNLLRVIVTVYDTETIIEISLTNRTTSETKKFRKIKIRPTQITRATSQFSD